MSAVLALGGLAASAVPAGAKTVSYRWSVSSTFTGKPHGSFKAETSRYGPVFDYDGTIHLSGTIRETDATRANPPAHPDDSPCRQPDTSGCTQVQLARVAALSLEPPATAHSHWALSGQNFLNAFNEPVPCQHGLFEDFSDQNLKFRSLLPKIPGARSFLAGPRRRTIRVSDTHVDRASDDSISGVTTRQVTLSFTRR